METVIKQAEENRSRSMGMANRFHEEYSPLKTEIDTMRREYLGLERLPELHEEEGSIVTPEYVVVTLRNKQRFISILLLVVSNSSSNSTPITIPENSQRQLEASRGQQQFQCRINLNLNIIRCHPRTLRTSRH